MEEICNVVHAAGQRAYAIRPYNSRKTYTAKNTFDVGKTMSDVEKITSDIIQIISDLFSPACNALKTISLRNYPRTNYCCWFSSVYRFCFTLCAGISISRPPFLRTGGKVPLRGSLRYGARSRAAGARAAGAWS